MKLRNLKKTCDACPAQWEAINEQDQHVYIRYRFDTLTVTCPFNPDWEAQDTELGSLALEMNQVHGAPYRGVMETDEMLAITGYSLESEASA